MEMLLKEIENLKKRYDLASKVTPDYYEPGMMEYLDKSYGEYDAQNNTALIRFEVKGTRYQGRSEFIEKIRLGDEVSIKRDRENKFNSNNFIILDWQDNDIGNMPAILCNAVAPLYDSGKLHVEKAAVSYVEPLSQRSRYAKQAMLFVELKIHFI